MNKLQKSRFTEDDFVPAASKNMSLEEGKVYEYRNSNNLVFLAYLVAAVFGGIMFYVDGVHKLYTMILAFAFFAYGIFMAIDSRVKLRIDDTGVSSHRLTNGHIAWGDVETFAIIQRTQAASIKYFLKLRTQDSKIHEVELSRLDAPIEDILQALDKHLEPFK